MEKENENKHKILGINIKSSNCKDSINPHR